MTCKVIIFSELDKGELFWFFHKKLQYFIEKNYKIVLHLTNFSIDITDKKTHEVTVTSVGKNENFQCRLCPCLKNSITNDFI